jgi:serine/threonine protein kinase
MFCCIKQNFKIILQNLIFVKVLYHNKNRSIKLYQDKDNNKNFFIIKEHKNIKLFRNELDMLCNLYHKNIIDLIYSEEQYSISYLKFPYYKNGDLFNYIQNNFPIKIENIKHYLKKIINSINYCHRHNIIHGDIKLENFVLDNNYNPILIDFESSQRITGQYFLESNVLNISGTLGYLSPECYLFQIGKCSDIWSLGCLLYHMVFGFGPLDIYLQINNMIHFYDWDRLDLYIKYPKNSDKTLIDLLKKMLEPYPTKRITMDEILKHPFIIE